MRILILSDFSSNNLGGGPVITGLFADTLRNKGIEVFEVNRRVISRQNSVVQSLLNNSNFLRELRGLVNPIALLSLYKQIRVIKPEVIWIHNVNNYWSWSSILISKRQSKTIVTCHDLSAISNLKLKKYNFNSNLQINYESLNMSRATIMLLRIKHRYIRFLFRQLPVVAIGEICQDVLEANLFRISERIPNRVEACTHVSNQQHESGTVLFAGRIIEKGLEETAIGVMQAGMRLFLAGPPELYTQALQYCPAEKIEYLGNKTNQELLKLLHRFEIVSVCSQSFDNYPTIGLEALVHGCKVVTSELTGLSRLLARHGINATVQVGQIPDFRKIQQIPDYIFQQDELMKEITGPTTTIEAYLELFLSKSTLSS